MSDHASLRDDTLVTYNRAVAELRAMARPLERVDASLSDAAGLVLAADVTARIPSPRRAVSVMDGYAIRARDLPGPFTIIGESAAGMHEVPAIGTQQAVRIYTGALVPKYADQVIVQEITYAEGDRLTLTGETGSNPYIRAAGSDFKEGAVLLRKGMDLTPARMVTAAAADRDRFRVWRRARVAILATGDELAAPGTAMECAGAIPDSISGALAAAVRNWGGEVGALACEKDDDAAIEGAASALLRASDILVVVGGASVGARDFAKHSLAGGDFHQLFDKVAMQPGKPVWCAASGSGRFVIGLPGNPVSAMVTARLFLAPLIAACAGRDFDGPLRWRDRRVVGTGIAGKWREQFARGVLQEEGVRLIRDQLSGSQASLAEADMLARIPAGDTMYADGAQLQTLPL